MEIDKDFIKIFVTTDNHLGYKYDDAILQQDSFINFEEALSIAQEQKCDFVFLLGDLFDVPNPNYECIDQALEIMEKTIGRKEYFARLYDCDRSEEYLIDEHSIPATLIHGNHDRPHNQSIYNIKHQNQNIKGCLDILERFKIIKYVGREVDYERLIIDPFLVKKKNITIAVYALGYTSDEYLNKSMEDNIIRFQFMGDYDHNVLIVHQNRLQGDQRSDLKPNLNLDLLNKYDFDLILWGHEHEPFKQLETFPDKYKFQIYQPGSTVATSLRQSEAIPKSVGIISFYKKVFQLKVIELKQPRKMLLLDFDLEKCQSQFNQNYNVIEIQIIEHVKKQLKLDDIKYDKLPLIRVRISCLKNVDLDKYQINYGLKGYAANKTNIINIRRKQDKNKKDQDQLFNFDVENFDFSNRFEYQYQRLYKKVLNINKKDTEILSKEIYFDIMKKEKDQQYLLKYYSENIIKSLETDFTECKHATEKTQQYLKQDVKELLDSDEKLKQLYEDLKDDVEYIESPYMHEIGLFSNIFNYKNEQKLLESDNKVSKIQFGKNQFLLFEDSESPKKFTHQKKFKKQKSSNKRYQLILINEI